MRVNVRLAQQMIFVPNAPIVIAFFAHVHVIANLVENLRESGSHFMAENNSLQEVLVPSSK